MPGQVAELVAEHIGLARKIAKIRAAALPPHVVFDDVFSDAMKGLWDAAQKFQPGRGVAFTIYAQWRIRGAIDDGLRQRDFLSRSHRAALKGRGEDGPRMMSLSTIIGHRDDTAEAVELVDNLPVGGRGPAQHRLDGEIIREHFQSLCRCLPPRTRLILTLYYVDGLSMAAVGRIVGLSESHICHIHGAAIIRLRRRMDLPTCLPDRQAGQAGKNNQPKGHTP